MSNDSLAIRLREARRMRKLSMDKISELVGFIVTNQSLSRYGRGVMRPDAWLGKESGCEDKKERKIKNGYGRNNITYISRQNWTLGYTIQ